ncbi:unnamed protein product, partial [Durusdinium trenchii]
LARHALTAAWGPEGVMAALQVGRYGLNEGDVEPHVDRLESVPEGVHEMHRFDLVHNGHVLHAIRGLWPTIMSASVAAACVLGLLEETSVLSKVKLPFSSASGLRLNAHLKLAPKVPGASQQQVSFHRDWHFWKTRFHDRPKDRARFMDASVTTWIPLVDVDRVTGAMAYLPQKLPHVVMKAQAGDVMLHNMSAVHFTVPMDNASEHVRWHVELRFHHARIADEIHIDDPLHEVMMGPKIDGIDVAGAYALALERQLKAAKTIRQRFNSDTVRSSLLGSKWTAPFPLPRVGLGTGRIWPHEAIAPALVSFGLLGGRHFDAADSYTSQQLMALALRNTGIPPKDLVVTTKIKPMGFQASLEAARKALLELDGVAQVVILLHLPGSTPEGKPFAKTVPESCQIPGQIHSWRKCRLDSYLALALLRASGVVSGIGVSNFLKRHLEELRLDLKEVSLPYKKWPPDVLQHEVHPLQREEQLRRYCRLWNISLVAFGSLGSPEAKEQLLHLPLVQALAEREGISKAQVLLKWALQKGLHVIPTTAKVHHMQELLEMEESRPLSKESLEALDALPEWPGGIYHPYLDRIQ